MHFLRSVVLAGSLLALGGTALARETPRSSWGRAGVGIDQYRSDAVECTRAGLGTDIRDLDAVKTLVAASQQIDTLLQFQQMAVASEGTSQNGAVDLAQQISRTVDGANAPARIREVRAVMMATIERCLADKGYVRFDLTPDQRRNLRRLRLGSPERHAYLHALASSADVLATQSPMG